MRPPSEDELTRARRVAGAAWRTGRSRRGSPTAWWRSPTAAQNASWATSPDQQLWQGLPGPAAMRRSREGYKARLTEYLARLMCRSRYANGAVADRVAPPRHGAGLQGRHARRSTTSSRSPTAPASGRHEPAPDARAGHRRRRRPRAVTNAKLAASNRRLRRFPFQRLNRDLCGLLGMPDVVLHLQSEPETRAPLPNALPETPRHLDRHGTALC